MISNRLAHNGSGHVPAMSHTRVCASIRMNLF